MASSSKKKTTFAKMNRENAVRERRLRKQAKKEARKQAAAAPPETMSEKPTDDGRAGFCTVSAGTTLVLPTPRPPARGLAESQQCEDESGGTHAT
jgi:hypothetical protein